MEYGTAPSAPIVRQEVGSVEVVVRNIEGLHCRPASLFAERAVMSESEIEVRVIERPPDQESRGHSKADGKSVFDLIFLEAVCGTRLEIRAKGPGAKIAVYPLRDLVEDGFGEECAEVL